MANIDKINVDGTIYDIIDEKVKIISTNPASTTTYYPTWVDSSGTKGENINNGFAYLSRNGTTSQDGIAVVQAGNAIASGTANNKKGYFRVYNKNSNYATIGYDDSAASDAAHTLPATGGTIVNNNTFRSQATVTTTENGLMIAADKVKLNNLDNTKDVDKNVNSATKLTKTETVLQTNQVPYVSRASLSPEGFSGYIREKLVGGSLAWNQKIPKTVSTTTYNGITFTNNNDGSWTLTGTATSENVFRNLQNVRIINYLPNHVYYVSAKSGHDKVGVGIVSQGMTGFVNKYVYNSEGIVKLSDFTVSGTTYGTWARLQVNQATGIDIGTCTYYPMVVDLTLMFGSTIADYIYNLETATAGAGVSLLHSLGFFTEPYYEQDSGSIQSVLTNSKKITGFNQWDEEWELGNYNASGQPIDATDRIRTKNYVPVLPNTDYYFYAATTGVGGLFYFYDANKEFISSVEKRRNTIFTTPQNAYYLRFRMYSAYGTAYKNDICINISDASKNGAYEPYHLDTIPLSATELRGIPKLDSNNNLYFDGDEYTSDGKIKRKYGIVDLGTYTWTYNSSYQYFYTSLPTDAKLYSTVRTQPFMCAKYQNISDGRTFANVPDKSIYNSVTSPADSIIVKDSAYTDAATFKTAMDGVYLVYELATPTEEMVLSYQNPQYAKDGTEEFVDGKTRDIAVPVGHVTEYMGTTAGEYQYLPTMPVDDEKYVLTLNNKDIIWKRKGWKFYKQASSSFMIRNDILTTSDEIMFVAHWEGSGGAEYDDVKVFPVEYLLSTDMISGGIGFYGNANTNCFVAFDMRISLTSDPDIYFYNWSIDGGAVSSNYIKMYYR